MDNIGTIQDELVKILDHWQASTRHVAAQIDPALGPQGMLILSRLVRFGPARLTDLAEYFSVGKPTMSRQVKTLESLHLVLRKGSEADARNIFFSATKEGERKFIRARGADWRWRREQLSSWDADELRRFADFLRRFGDIESRYPSRQ